MTFQETLDMLDPTDPLNEKEFSVIVALEPDLPDAYWQVYCLLTSSYKRAILRALKSVAKCAVNTRVEVIDLEDLLYDGLDEMEFSDMLNDKIDDVLNEVCRET
jgi:hypothetical protein